MLTPVVTSHCVCCRRSFPVKALCRCNGGVQNGTLNSVQRFYVFGGTNRSTKGFIESIGKLINVKESSTTLKSDIEDTNEALLKSGGEFMGKLKDLVEARTIQRNIITTIEEMTNCLSVIKL